MLLLLMFPEVISPGDWRRTDLTAVQFDASDGVEVVTEDVCSGKCLVAVVAVMKFAEAAHVTCRVLREIVREQCV